MKARQLYLELVAMILKSMIHRAGFLEWLVIAVAVFAMTCDLIFIMT